jgi:hypothetical protein
LRTFILTSFFLLFFSAASAQQNNCIMLEGINLGCVSSIDHSCFINKKLDLHNEPCPYVGSPNTMWRVEAPISFHCKSTRTNTFCPPQQCNADGCIQPPCVTTSECVEYMPPACSEECVKCFDEVVNVNIGTAAGCIICTRNMCPDEMDHQAKLYCPATYNGLVNYQGLKCSTEAKCPTSAVDPLGVVREVTINRGTCPPPELPPVPTPVVPKDCPWKLDERSDTGCERIRCDNMNPSAPPGCVDP